MIKVKSAFCLLIFIMLSLPALSQNENVEDAERDIFSKIQQKEQGQGDVIIFQDMRVNELVYNHVEQNKRKGIPGFRIRIYADLGSGARDQSQDAKARFYGLFPEIPIYLEYVSPYFRVLVGDYRTKVDALKDFNRIKQYFPSAFIVPEEIDYPEMEE